MTGAAIRVTGLSKRYQLGESSGRYRTLREAIGATLTAPVRRLRDGRRREPSTIWALRDVSFDVEAGQVVGIIGQNGAGKSTLLKVLTRITEPTRGRAEIRGRVASLLEVGTGFHPELTGRENITLNGAILGMSRREIVAKFDRIAEFAGVERFLDTPVKRYSSGMYLRLAFAVAAHLDPEILIVDEVLAVGDAAFQKKCSDKMEEIGSGGRTVLFVSHNLGIVQRLCRRVIRLAAGEIVDDGPASGVIQRYLGSGNASCAVREWPELATAPGDAVVRLRSVRVLDSRGIPSAELEITEPFAIEVAYLKSDPAARVSAALELTNDEGVLLFLTHEFNGPDWNRSDRSGEVRATCRLPGNLLAEGWLSVKVAVSSVDPPSAHAVVNSAVTFEVIDRLRGDSVRGTACGDWPGVMRPMLEWSSTSRSDDLATGAGGRRQERPGSRTG